MATSTARKPHQRYYARDGTLLPGVTTILNVIAKPALVGWANKLGFQRINSTEFLNHVADSGTLAHGMIANRLGGPASDVIGYAQDQISMAQNALASFHAWAQDKALETREMELALVSEDHRYGGTFDWYGLLDGVLTLIDFKTSSGIYPDHCYQVSAYHHLLIENGYEVAEARVLQVGRDAGDRFTERVLSSSEVEPYFEVFKAALLLKGAIDATKERRGRRWRLRG